MTSRRALIVVENDTVPRDRRVWQQALSLKAAGWDVTVLAPRFGDDQDLAEQLDGIEIHRFGLREADGGPMGHVREYAAAAWQVRRRLRDLVDRAPFDVIQACNPPDFLLALAGDQRRRGTALIFDQHDLVPEMFAVRFGERFRSLLRLTRATERLAYRLADVVLVTNESFRRVAIERGGKDAGDVYVVRNGPRLDRFTPVGADARLKQGRRFLLAYVGLMQRQDGVDRALRALEILRRRREDWRAVFLGDGEMLPSLVALAQRLGLSDLVEFPGYVGDDQLRLTVSSADVCLAPDEKNELTDVSTLMKIAEYMALGRPVVSFDLRESRVTAGEAAVFAPDNDPESFAALIDELLDDPTRRRTMGAEGRRRVETLFAWEHSERALLAGYDHALQRGLARATSAQAPRAGLAGVKERLRPTYNLVRRLATSWTIERWLGIDTSLYLHPRELEGHGAGDAHVHEASPWLTLRRALSPGSVADTDVFLDLGSGMGRAVYLAAARYKFKRVIGVEISPRLHAIAQQNIDANRHRLRAPVELVCSDAGSYDIPTDVTVVYLYNPFSGDTFAEVARRLIASFDSNPRRIRVLYRTPEQEDQLLRTERFKKTRTVRGLRPGRQWSRTSSTEVYEVLPPS